MAALAQWCVRHRLVAVLLWLLALGGTGAAAVIAGSSYSNDYDVPGTESGRATRLLAEGFPGLGGDSDTVVWHTDPGTVRAAAVEQTMTRTLARIADLPGVASVAGPYDDQGAARISADGHTAYATVTFEDSAENIDRGEARAVVDTAAAARTDGLRVELGGSAIALTESSGGHLAEVVGVAVAAVVLFLAFGSLAASTLPIATALVGVGTAYAGIVLLGHVMTVADFAPMLGMLVGLGVGIDYALFIVTRHRRGLKRGLPVAEAAENAVATTGRAVVFAGATVCIALLGMLILRLDFLNGVAIAASLTVVLTVAASVTLLPALLSFIGPRALSRRERRRLAEHGPEPELPTGLAARWSAFVERHPKVLGALALVVIAGLAVPTLSLRLGTSDQGNGPETATTRQAYDLLADGFGPGVNGPLTLVTRVDSAQDRLALDNLDATLRGTEGVAAVTPVTYSAGGDTAHLTVVPESSPQSPRTSDLVDLLRTEVLPRAETGTSLDVQVGGVTAGYDDFAEVIVGKLPLFVGVVVGLGCLLLLLAFRSVGIPLKAAVMNVAAVAAAFGVVVAVFQWGWRERTAGPRPGRADRTLPSRDHGRGPLRALHGLPGLPGQPDVRGVAGDRRQPAGRARRARRDQPGDQLRGGHHDLRLPGLRPQRRPCDRHVRHRAGRGRRPRRVRPAHPPRARADAPARRRQLVAAPLARPAPAADQHRAARVPGRP
ncbi:RND superfamily putative drug exporter [Streptomyces phaeoluteigriseus]